MKNNGPTQYCTKKPTTKRLSIAWKIKQQFHDNFRIILRDTLTETFHEDKTLPKSYPEGASSNPTRVNIFQLTSALSDYYEKFNDKLVYIAVERLHITVSKVNECLRGYKPSHVSVYTLPVYKKRSELLHKWQGPKFLQCLDDFYKSTLSSKRLKFQLRLIISPVIIK